MRKMFDFNKAFKKILIIYAALFVAGVIVAAVFGVNLDINFKGGTKISYSYTGDLADKDIKTVVDEKIEAKYELTKSTSIAGDTKTFEISLVGKDALSAENQEELSKALTEKFKDNKKDT